jgi:hypothetical protein
MKRTTRREFVWGMGTGAAALALHGCAGVARARVEPGGAAVAAASRLRDLLGPERERVLAAAARAPSTHNSQPWRVRVLEPNEWTVEADTSRRLPAVDPADRELVLSLGAFLEVLVTAAAALGFDARIDEAPGGAFPPAVGRVRLSRAPSSARGVEQLQRIAQRRTLRKGYSSAPLAKDDLDALTAALGPRARWFPPGTREADWLREVAVQSFEHQTWREPAQQELARWIRFSDAEARRSADGLTPDTMEVGGLAGFYMRHFMDPESVTAKNFRDRGVDAVRAQAREGAGWFALGALDESMGSLLGAGRALARMALLLRERRLAAHPMSQVLEEDPWRGEAVRTLGVGSPQFVLRVGYVERYPEPVSLRRPVSAFASLG